MCAKSSLGWYPRPPASHPLLPRTGPARWVLRAVRPREVAPLSAVFLLCEHIKTHTQGAPHAGDALTRSIRALP